jgi:hypothetical protein
VYRSVRDLWEGVVSDVSAGDVKNVEATQAIDPAIIKTNGGDHATAAEPNAAEPRRAGNADGSGQWSDMILTNPPEKGSIDPSGCPIDTIYASTRQFFIYEAGGQVRFLLPEDYEVARKLRRRIADLGGLRASIEDLRNHPSLAGSNEKERTGREISWALAQAFEDEANPPSDRPKEILTRVDTRLRSLVKSQYRKNYAIANLMAFGAIEIILLLIAIVFSYPELKGNLAALPRYATYAAFGGLGAFLSVITGIRNVDFDINLTKWEHVFSGATRILIGVVGAVVVALALDSAFIDPTFGNSTSAGGSKESISGLDRKTALSFVFAFIGGFSESLVPNLLRRGEQAAGASDKVSTSSDPIVKDMKP